MTADAELELAVWVAVDALDQACRLARALLSPLHPVRAALADAQIDIHRAVSGFTDGRRRP
jgi:hypothetical protein